ncbi:MAG TPA: aminoacyl-tRNA hydrolase [Chitinophagales bacterium]|nr:aminoacyl-tRNA hydrolase [Chitinophagales bacterium]
MKYLIAGLGNIGDDYVHTRHNIGFDIVNSFLPDPTVFSLDRHAYHASLKFKGRTLHLIKPTTYMNLSGKAVKYWMEKEKIPLENTLVICDDIALPFGKIRIRKEGSDGGHNGLKSVIETLGTTAFPRLRFGIGGDFPKGYQVDYVLGKWTEEELKLLPEKISAAADAVRSFVTEGIDRAMSRYN